MKKKKHTFFFRISPALSRSFGSNCNIDEINATKSFLIEVSITADFIFSFNLSLSLIPMPFSSYGFSPNIISRIVDPKLHMSVLVVTAFPSSLCSGDSYPFVPNPGLPLFPCETFPKSSIFKCPSNPIPRLSGLISLS
jgi:hypothetical protein